MRNILIPLLFCLSGLYIAGCSDDPTSLGKDFFSGQNLKLDSLIINAGSDSVHAVTYYKAVPLYLASYLLVGNVTGSEPLQAWTAIRFTPATTSSTYKTYLTNGTLTVKTAQIVLTPYYQYGDTTQSFAMGYSQITHSWTESRFTSDSAMLWDDKSFTPATFTSQPSANILDTLNIDPATALNWLKACVDTPYTEYGILLKPASSVTNRIIGFDASGAPPILYLTFTAGTDTTTLTASYYATSQTHVVYPAPSSGTDSLSGKFVLKNGISSTARLSYPSTALPPNAIINNAVLSIVADTLNCKFGYADTALYKSSLYVYSELYDTSEANLPDANYIGSLSPSNGVYSGTILRPVSREYLLSKGLNLILRSGSYQDGVEKYVFFDPSNSDRAKKPLLKIYFTRRGTN